MKIAVIVGALMGGMVAVSSLAAEQPTYTAEDIAKAKPSGTIEVEAEQIRLILGGSQGKGVLHYQGKTYPFTLKGLTAGGVGINKVNATGDVYFLKSPEDFAGTYSAITAGATVGKGVGGSQYQNGKGVFVSVKSKSSGAGLFLGIGGIEVTMQ